MADNYWLGGSGVQSWTNIANWSLGAAPVSTNRVFILQGTSDIQTNLAQSAVALAALTVAGSFNGTIQTSAGGPLEIGISSTNPVTINTQATGLVFDFGSSTPQIIIQQTGQAETPDGISAPTVGTEAVRIRGGASGTNLYITGSSSVGVATDLLAATTSVLTSWNITSGNLNLGTGVTWTNGYQAGQSSVLTQSAGTLIQQSGSGPNLVTSGTGKITTINLTSSGIINNRPASGTECFDTLSIGPSATANFAGDARSLTCTNPILMAFNSSLIAFRPDQIKKVGGSDPFEFKTQACSLADVFINCGTPVFGTVKGY